MVKFKKHRIHSTVIQIKIDVNECLKKQGKSKSRKTKIIDQLHIKIWTWWYYFTF